MIGFQTEKASKMALGVEQCKIKKSCLPDDQYYPLLGTSLNLKVQTFPSLTLMSSKHQIVHIRLQVNKLRDLGLLHLPQTLHQLALPHQIQ